MATNKKNENNTQAGEVTALKEIGLKVLKDNPAFKSLYVTTDGMTFVNKNDATAWSRDSLKGENVLLVEREETGESAEA
ncbi:MAG: hypothetical protein LBH19_11230 [Dysgonamonadaceae bacterium]|jgi:hypothetical protein|nr:hypothetical protein [Dysgonamonadaceae bacterium]